MTINNTERRKYLAGEIGKAICNLANIAEDWNDAQEEPDERGRGNGAIGLIVFEDGSGFVAEFQQSPNNDPLGNGYVVKKFHSPEEAEDYFAENVSARSLLDTAMCGDNKDYCARSDPGGTYIVGEQRYCWDCHRPRRVV